MLQDTYHQLWGLLRAFIDLASAAAGAAARICALVQYGLQVHATALC